MREGAEIRRIENQINNMLFDEEVYWKQRSRADWLREGDKNTKFFHSKASDRGRKNMIWGVENNQGQWTVKQDEVEREFRNYFQSLFISSSPTYNQIQAVLEELPAKVTPEMNAYLEEPFSPEEIVEALSQTPPTKALGPDGLPAAFFPKALEISS